MQYQVQYKWQFKDKIRYMWIRITFSSKSFNAYSENTKMKCIMVGGDLLL